VDNGATAAELFAGDRYATLMHWVNIGSGVAVAGGVYGSVLSKSPWPLIGAVAVAAGMYLAYGHAVKRGISQPPPRDSNGN